MDNKDAEFLKRIQATFRVEAQEHLRGISEGLLALEKAPEPTRRAQLIETVFRETHSLKGAARAVDQRHIESLCQPLESVFAAWKNGRLEPAPDLGDLFQQALDQMQALLALPPGPLPGPERARQNELLGRLLQASQPGAAPPPRGPTSPGGPPGPGPGQALPAEPAASPPPAGPLPPLLGQSVRILTAQLDPLLWQAEEMVQAKVSAGQRVADLEAILRELAAGRARPRGKAGPGQAEDQALGEKALRRHLEDLAKALAEDHRALKRMVDEHLEEMKKVLMLPVASAVDVLPRLVRDLSREQGKEVDLAMGGLEIALDKRVLEELKTPLIHLLRNCVDHGMAKPSQRLAQGKPAQGTITLGFAALDSRQVEITLADDGQGIDLERVRATAVAKGVLAPEAAQRLEPDQVLDLVFQSGVSTSPLITDVSGRGLGLAIVREKVEGLGGSVRAESRPGSGCVFHLLVPMTLSAFRGVLVRAEDRLFLVPTVSVRRVLRLLASQVEAVENRRAIRVEGQVLGLVSLAQVLGLARRPGAPRPGEQGPGEQRLAVLLLAASGRRLAFQVDEILDERQVLLKGLGRQLKRVHNFSGAAVLGSGQVVPVIHTPDLMQSALKPQAQAGQEAGPKGPLQPGRLLVAEDSITARTLIKNILETAGYQVATAVDGLDAFTQLRAGDFNLVVSDVDMPRLNGFELTTKIRADRRLAELPVVLVTALSSSQDRERGVEVGADAYIVKSSFDQSNLLGVIRSLL